MSEATGGHDTLPELRTWVSEDGGEAASGERAAASQEAVGEQQWSEEDWQQWNRGLWGWRGQGHSWSYSTSGGSQVVVGAGTLPAAAASADSAARDPWLDHDPWQRQSWSWDQVKGKDDWWRSSSKGDYADPPSWAGWGHYRLWRRALLRWNSNTDVAQYRRAEKILKSLEWELQAKLEHIDEGVLASPGYLDAIFGVLDVLAGEREDSEKRRSIRAALYEGNRRSEESLAQYALRRESQFASASKYMVIPDELKAFMLEEESGLTKQGSQNLRVLTEGRHEYDRVRRALQVLDVEEESLFKSGKSNYMVSPEEEDEISEEETDDDQIEEEIFAVIKDKDLDENEALSFLAQHVPRRRTWSENKQLKAAKKKDRRHFDDRSSRPERPRSHKRLPIAELKKITRCSNCGARGHWKEDCDKPYRSKESREKAERSLPGASAFVFLGTGEGEKFGGSFLLCPSFSEDGSLTFLSLPSGHAIVDPGASQDLIGLKSYERLVEALAHSGLKPIKLSEKPAPASGVGGDAKPLFNALVPCILGGKPGIIKMTIVQEDIPQLLSVGLLEHAGAVIDVAKNQLEFRTLGSSTMMNRLNSGHRTIDVASWKGGVFPVPEQLETEFCLKPGAFNSSDSSAVRAYMQLSEVGDGDRLFLDESVLRQVINKHQSVVEWNQHVFFVSSLNQPLSLLGEQTRRSRCNTFRSSWLFSDSCSDVVVLELSCHMPYMSEDHLSQSMDQYFLRHENRSREGFVLIQAITTCQVVFQSDRDQLARSSAVSKFQLGDQQPNFVSQPVAHGEPSSERSTSRASSGQLVADGAPDSQPEKGAHESAIAGGSSVAVVSSCDVQEWGASAISTSRPVSSPPAVRGTGGQPTWHVEEVQSVSEAAEVPEVQPQQPTSCEEESDQEERHEGDVREHRTSSGHDAYGSTWNSRCLSNVHGGDSDSAGRADPAHGEQRCQLHVSSGGPSDGGYPSAVYEPAGLAADGDESTRISGPCGSRSVSQHHTGASAYPRKMISDEEEMGEASDGWVRPRSTQ